ncbi:hypothetical protein O1611_g2183 [Lasiodiplodia mahajangana]|uniref:Uncharacterized protein n=1 Tax=Lasiodiplodia mahajangana TaxID=1108764 RepID=A0ACC2JVZ1_9PEZI|nr:hypothetical protein O1611_g2183 [Lasiodiplodia mahajangana]
MWLEVSPLKQSKPPPTEHIRGVEIREGFRQSIALSSARIAGSPRRSAWDEVAQATLLDSSSSTPGDLYPVTRPLLLTIEVGSCELAEGISPRWPSLSLPHLSSDTELQILTHSPRSIESLGETAPNRQASAFPGDMSNDSDPGSRTAGSTPDRNPLDEPILATGSAEDPQYTYDIRGDTTDRVRRELTPFQMIALNATLGVGLYWRAGQILELAGPVAVLVAFILLTLLAWAVMQCVGEMIGRWPVPGALSVFVSNFIDYELGIAVGIMYWLTYSVGFAALIATSSSEIRYWTKNEALEATIVYIVIPLILIVFNCFPVKYYGQVEVVFGIFKISFLFIIIVAMIILSSQPGSPGPIEYNWDNMTLWDVNASPTRGPAFLTAINTAVFAFVGVEIVAACALEAKPSLSNAATSRKDGPKSRVMSSRTRFSVIYFSLIVGAAYTISGLLATFNVRYNDPSLPRLSWLDQGSSPPSNTSSVFVLAANNHRSKGLASTFNVFLVFTALSSVQTNLYVASRALYGLATQLRGSEAKFLDMLSFFGETNGRGVPVRAVVVSALAFVWAPFLQLLDYHSKDTTVPSAGISSFIDILTQLGSVGVIIVWACECVAFLSYRHYLKKHGDYLRDNDPNYVDRKDHMNYPYRSHFQPVIGSLAFVGCLFVLIVLGSAALYHGFHVVPFLSQFLAIILFAGLWAFLKVYRRRKLDRDYYFDVDSSASGFRDTLTRLSNLVNQ